MEVRSFVRMNNEIPDAESPKLFVGQIPYSWNETDIGIFFDKFGGIYCIDVVRDKVTKQSKGCCFIQYFNKKSALDAQSQCHNLKTLPGMNHPLQIKMADKEYVHERRISVEMLSKKLNEADIRQIFQRFGLIEDCVLLRDQNGSSRGMAFLTFSSKVCAHNAIKEMHQSMTMEGCPFPLLVKLAEAKVDVNSVSPSVLNAMADIRDPPGIGALNQQQQLVKRSQFYHPQQQTPCSTQQQLQNVQANNNNNTTQSNISSKSSSNNNNNTPSYPPGLQPIIPGGGGGGGGNILNTMNVIPLPPTCPTMQPNFSYMMQNMNSGPPPNHPPPSGVYPVGASNTWRKRAPNCFGHPSGSGTGTGGTGGIRSNLPMSGSGAPVYSYSSSSPAGNSYPCHASNMNNQSGGPNSTHNNPNNQKIPMGRYAEGSTLFVYDLPPEYKEKELCQTFSRFGKVISTKVFVDKDTNRSKCFGFVSYDSVISAQAAILAMNGVQMGSRRLQVRIKKPKEKL